MLCRYEAPKFPKDDVPRVFCEENIIPGPLSIKIARFL